MTFVSCFKIFDVLFCHYHVFAKMFFLDLTTVFDFWHLFYKFVYCVFSSVDLNWFCVVIVITTNYFISENLVLSTELIMQIDHRTEISKS